MKHEALALLVVVLGGCAGSGEKPPAPPPVAAPPVAPAPPPAVAVPAPSATPAPAGPATLSAKSVALPGSDKPASIDLVAYEPGKRRVWVPVGNTGSVDVYDIASGAFARIDGFKTKQVERHGKKRTAGPSAVAIGDGVAYVGNRGTEEVCAVDVATLKRGTCVKLSTGADFVTYVASTKEVWVTTPHDKSLVVLDASKPARLVKKATIKLDGSPEGAAVDAAGGRYFTNFEDKDLTVAVDLETRKQIATWKPECGDGAPHGLAYDAKRQLLIVGCGDHLQVLDAAHDGAPLGKLDTGAGVDDIGYLGDKQLVFAAASHAAKLTIAHVGDGGKLDVVATAQTGEGARNAVADDAGNAYVADAPQASLLVVASAAK